MSHRFEPVCPAQESCKCCGTTAALYGVVDFNKNCEQGQGRGLVLPPAGVPVYYYRCAACGFLFTTALDRFTSDDFRCHIYNADYVLVDPDYAHVRPRANADLVTRLFAGAKPQTVLDYGGGNGVLAEALRATGFSTVDTYDLFEPRFAARPAGRYECVVSFEVVEHATDPGATLADMMGLVADPGLLLFSTVTQPADIDRWGLAWWYAGPRNGHVSLHTRHSLAALAGRQGFRYGAFNDTLHVVYRNVPEFARPFFPSDPRPA